MEVGILLITREILTLSDGGEIALDWGMLNTDSGVHTEGSDGVTPPVLLILAGITGCSTDNYVQHLVEDGLLEGYITVVFNQRGNGGIKLKVSGEVISGTNNANMYPIPCVQYKYEHIASNVHPVPLWIICL